MVQFAFVHLHRAMCELIGLMRHMTLGCMQLVRSHLTRQSENAY